MKTYHFPSLKDGLLVEFNKNPKTKEVWTLNCFDGDEECEISGHSPLIFDSKNELLVFIKESKDFIHFLDSGYQILIKKIRLVE